MTSTVQPNKLPKAVHTPGDNSWRRLPYVALALIVVKFGGMSAQAQSLITMVNAGASPTAVALSLATNKICVANKGSDNLTIIDGATYATTTVSTGAGSGPSAIAINSLTNKAYVANGGSGSVAVIDVATAAVATVAGGRNPSAIVVNPLTSRIYVANSGDGSVTVIDGATNATATVAVGSIPSAIAINPLTNRIYVANNGDGSVTVIDGGTNRATSVPVGSAPSAIAVDVVTDTIYVANKGGGNVTVIDGATNATTTVAVGSNPDAIAVNPLTNKIYVANSGSGNVTVIDGATNAATAITAGTNPSGIAVNPLTNQIYVANGGSGSVTVIDGATNTTKTLAAGSNPAVIAVNPVTDKIYIANIGSGNVTVIDGSTNGAATIAVGAEPYVSAINPMANRIYIANQSSSTVSVIDGTTNTVVATVATTGPTIHAIAANPFTNKIYVGDSSANVTVIDGTTNAATTVALEGPSPNHIAINPITNKIYIVRAMYGHPGSMTAIDGVTNTTTIVAQSSPDCVVVNPATNKIYASNLYINDVSVIDGVTNAILATISTGEGPGEGDGMAVDPVTNKIYVTNYDETYLTAIDGGTNAAVRVGIAGGATIVALNPLTDTIYVPLDSVLAIDGVSNAVTPIATGAPPSAIAINQRTNEIYAGDALHSKLAVVDGAAHATIATVPVGVGPIAIAVNPMTNAIYVSNYGDPPVFGNTMTAIWKENLQPVPLRVNIVPLAENQTTSLAPTFAFTAQSGFSPTTPPPQNIFFQVDTAQGPWTRASINGSSFSGTVASSLQPGPHILYAYADDGQDFAQPSSPLVSALGAYEFLVMPQGAPVLTLLPSNVTVHSGSTAMFTAAATGAAPLSYQWMFNGSAIAGATSAGYTIGSAGLANAGGYTVAVSNTAGQTISEAATLAIADPPVISAQPISQTVAVGSTVTFHCQAGGVPAPTLQWSFNGTPLAGGTSGSTVISGTKGPILVITGPTAANAGSYTCTATNAFGTATSAPAILTVIASSSDPGRLIDLSCRGQVGTGANVLISGFVVGGNAPGGLPVLIRASGPAIAAAPINVPGTLPDPKVELHQSVNGTDTVLASNTGWGGNALIASTAASVGAFSWGSAATPDSALVENLSAGAFSAVISGAAGTAADAGVALAEVYDATPSGAYVAGVSPRLVNLSARVQVGSGANVLIVGFVVGGSTAKTVLIRASGPAIAALNVPGTLADPSIALHTTIDGADTILASDAGWGGNDQIAAAAAGVGAFSWGASATPDAALLVTLPPGAYSAVVSGAAGTAGDVGVGLVEVYEVP